mgnify:CR=1 FL=1
MLAYLFIGLTVDELVLCTILAAVCTLVTHAAAEAVLRALRREGSVQILLAGLFLWAYGLILFDRQLKLPSTSLTLSYLALCLCGGGSAIQPLYDTIADTTGMTLHTSAELLGQRMSTQEPWMYLRAIGGVDLGIKGGLR